MFPVLFSIASVPVSSLGIFLVLGLFYAIFLIWRLARAWDYNEERVLDLAFLTAFGAFIVARVYFALQYFTYFSQDFTRVFLIFKYPGFSFWGAFLGGWLTLYFASRRFKLDFASVADIASVGFLGGLIFGNIGCLFGGCGVGVVSNSFLATNMAGFVGKRFPIQGVEALLMAILLIYIWPKATHFHIPGRIVSIVLVYVGGIKFATEFFRSSHQGGQFFSLMLVILGVVMFYRFSRRDFRQDVRSGLSLSKQMLRDRKLAKQVLQNLCKSWYNAFRTFIRDSIILLKWRTRSFHKILRKFNVKSNTNNS